MKRSGSFDAQYPNKKTFTQANESATEKTPSEIWLKIFSYSSKPRKIGCVCHSWHDWIFNPNNHNHSLYRSIQTRRIEELCAEKEFYNAYNICNVHITANNQYFLSLRDKIIQKILTSESFNLFLDLTQSRHTECTLKIKKIINNQPLHNLGSLENHIDSIIKRMFQYIVNDEEIRKKGYFLIAIPYTLLKLIPEFEDRGKINIIRAFQKYLIKKDKYPTFIQLINNNFSPFFLLIKNLFESENSSLEVKQNALFTMGLMALHLTNNANNTWSIFLNAFQNTPNIKISESYAQFPEKITHFISWFNNNLLFIECFKNNPSLFMTFLQTLFNKSNNPSTQASAAVSLHTIQSKITFTDTALTQKINSIIDDIKQKLNRPENLALKILTEEKLHKNNTTKITIANNKLIHHQSINLSFG